jgi:minor extracellular serine protease Vpr
LALSLTGAPAVWAQFAANRYALILEDPPVSAKLTGRAATRSLAATAYAQQIEARQQSLLSDLRSRNIPVTGRAATLANVVFVSAPKSRTAELKSLAGVKGVVPVRVYKRKLNRATQLINLQGAWNVSGGPDNAGKGVKIGILDTGIDQTHAAFQDSSLAMPAGYPICSGTDCAYTSNKVIVARSYVRQIAAGTGDDPAADSRPDDYSPRDRIGHGTAVASVAAGVANGGTVAASGMAPKAYIGNYKIYGSPYINDGTTDEVIIQALDDAFNDGMDIVSFSTGGPAFSGPLDTGAACGNDEGVPCDLMARAFENAVAKGMIMVASAGNEGDTGAYYPAFGTIATPAHAPSVIAVGATTNSHEFTPIVTVPGSDAPSSLKAIATETGDAYLPSGAVSLPLRDVTVTGNDGLACAAMPDHSLDGTFALIQRGTCTFSIKLSNAWNAGAMGAIFYMADDSPSFGPGGLSSFSVPAAMVSRADGLALKEFIAAHPNHLLTLNPAGTEQDVSGYNQLSYFSSLGPATGTSALKPDLVATGANMYMATQGYDPLSDMYGADGYVVANGTSFSTPLVSGAAAILKQLHPSWTPAQIRSALVNTTTHEVSVVEYYGDTLDIRSLGAGKLDAGAAAATVVTSNPSSISFGALVSAALPVVKTIEVTNSGSAAVTLTAATVAEKASSTAQLTLDPQTLSLAPGATAKLTATLTGTLPAAGSFSGNITLSGSGLSLKVPYLFLVSNGVAANMIPLANGSFEGPAGGHIAGGIIAFRLVDAYGVPVSGAPVTFSPRFGVTLEAASSTTDAYGIAYAVPILPSVATSCSIVAVAAGMRMTFSGSAIAQPAISSSGGVLNGASFDTSAPIAPGSYISVFGTALGESTNYPTTSTLPMVLDYIMVSFDVPSAGISVPGRITYISPTQVNLQVPWELQGQAEARVKVIYDYINGSVVKVQLADYSPAFFEVGSGAVAALDANYSLVSATNAQSAGQVVMLYANGLGPVTNQPASGEPAPGNPLAQTKSKPVVTIGGKQADVSFSGLAPGFAGLYQINATIPSGLTAGNQPITVSIGGKTSKTSTIAVQ